MHTDDKGLATETVHLKTTNGPLPAYVAAPTGKGPFPVVLVVQEIFGVHEHIKDVCRRFAKLGAMAIAPDLYARYGDVTKVADVQEILRTVVAKDIQSPVLGLYGGRDQGIPVESIDKMKAALKGGKAETELVVYPEAGRAFFADYDRAT